MTQALNQLRPTLERIDPDHVRAPTGHALELADRAREMCVFLQEDPELIDALSSIGQEDLERVERACQALEAAEAQWCTYLDACDGGLGDVEVQARQARDMLVAACRFFLRGERSIQLELAEIQTGEGAADLILDLDTLANLVRARARSFRADPTFQARDRAREAHALARSLRSTLYEHLDDPESHEDARSLRNRAYTHLDDLVYEIRAALAYKFCHDPEILRSLRPFRRAWHGF